MKAKPIEPGCLAMITGCGRDVGFITTAVKPVRAPVSGTEGWEINPRAPSMQAWNIGVRTDCLLRLDDPDIEKQLQQEREKEHA